MSSFFPSRALGVLVLCTALPTLAHAVDLPTRKPGLWEVKMIMAGAKTPAMTMHECTDASTDKEMTSSFAGTDKDACTKNDIKKTATGFAVDSQCKADGAPMTMQADISGDFNSAYTVRVKSKVGGKAPQSTDVTMDAKWIGACPAGQKPGDVVLPGMK
ncbi:DUF3617 domain-containing protein [Bradyrhizobium prioriisuperbiae]|uniref:DUF3617 domain-containing protein n=1 Tax=Bradyrhizobium prioriisuperbiae TaxID=2854389 RepID=UPI0028EF5298|nr:DUF3617 family protein [Bradyrhizobium prioritasuperba]